jgi:uracil-DNA glycosylase
VLEDLLSPVHPTWLPLLEPLEPELRLIVTELDRQESEGAEVLPARSAVLRALSAPLASSRVLVVGQDPYPTPGHPVGLSFAVKNGTRPLARSLKNIFKELESDLGRPAHADEDLEHWRAQGVVLLNRSLTLRAGEANSHAKIGWVKVTDALVKALAAQPGPLVALLWGANAQTLEPLLGEAHVIKSAHPSPLSASRGFFGSKPFSRTNDFLVSAGADPVDW